MCLKMCTFLHRKRLRGWRLRHARLPERDRWAASDSGDPAAQERQTMEEVECGHGAQQRHEAIRACKRLGRSIWKKWSGYHQRSLVQTKLHGFASSGWVSAWRYHARWSAKLWSWISVSPCWTVPARSIGLKPCRWLTWHRSVWRWGHAVCYSICATKPLAIEDGLAGLVRFVRHE